MTTPLVSICCLAYNHAPYIRQCLDGFMMQKTDFPFEVLIHDDASTDATADIIREYEQKYPDIIKPIYQTENQHSKGVRISATYNWPRAKGKYIAICEGDDYWTDPLKLQKQADFLERNPEYGLCYTKARQYSQDRRRFLVWHWGGPCSLQSLVTNNSVPTLTICVRKELLFQYVRELKTETRDWKIGDYPLLFWFACNSKLWFMNEFTGVYRILKNSAVHKTSYEETIKVIEESLNIRRFFIDYYNLLELKDSFEDYALVYYAAAAIRFKKYALYKECIIKVKSGTWKVKARKIISKSNLLMLLYHYYLKLRY